MGEWIRCDERMPNVVEMEALPKVYVFCNSCSHEWHEMMAMAEDGTCLAGHICSIHGWAWHDMGIDRDGWKRDLYATHYPNGFDVEWVDNPRDHAGLMAAYAKNQAKRSGELEVPRG